MFLNLPGFVPKINEAVLGELFTYRCLSGEQTLMDGVYTLEPGFFVTVDMADPLKFDKKSYWCLERDIRDIVYEDAIQKTLELLKDSLRLRKISDVPHGLLLSGGLDSSILAAFDKELSKELLMTFSVGFEEDAFDESPYFTFVSEKYNTRHRSYVFNQSEIVDCYKKCIWHLEESINHPHTPLIYLISKEIKTYVTVLLTGEASDEIFAGYARYLDAHHAISNGAGADATILNSSSLMTPEVLERLLPSKRHRASIAARQDLIKNTEGMSFLQRLQFYDLKTYLPSLLTRLDKMTMASSIEARVPFMDWRLVQFAFSLPDAYKINQNVTKAILKDIAKVYFPHEFVHRPKVGFRTPFRSWLRANGCFKDILLKEESPADGFLNQSYLSSVAKRFFDGDDSFECSDVVWSVMNLKIWCRLFLEGEGKLQSS